MNLAWKEAERLVTRLPRHTTWSFTITDIEDDAVLNIYVDAELRESLRVLLGLNSDPAETGADYVTWFNGSLAVSLIQPEEEEDGPEPDYGFSF